MSRPEPPITLTPRIISLAAEVGELVGGWKAGGFGMVSPRLRGENRIRTIQASLAIENNSLSLDQVTAIIEGSMISDRQAGYYEALGEADRLADSATFVEFMLAAIRDTLVSTPSTDQVSDQASDQVRALLRCFKGGREMTATSLMERLKLRHRPTFRKNHLNPALALGLIEMTDPASPRSPVQRYRVTEKAQRIHV